MADHIGGIQPSAQPCFQNHKVRFHPSVQIHGHEKHKLKKGWMCVAFYRQLVRDCLYPGEAL